MAESRTVGTTPGVTNSVGAYTVYFAGGLFTHHELAANIMIKEAVWRTSNGRFQLLLPQSRELQQLDIPNVEAYLRNIDILEVVGADIILARFDGAELDSGTVLEFAVAKSLGKPTLILRSDFRRLYSTGLSEPYNLMVKNWPRTVEVRLDSYRILADLFAEARQALAGSDTSGAVMEAELGTVEKSVDYIAEQVIDGLEAVLEMESPYPPAYQEAVYQAVRFSPGSGFDAMLTPDDLDEIIQRLRENGTL